MKQIAMPSNQPKVFHNLEIKQKLASLASDHSDRLFVFIRCCQLLVDIFFNSLDKTGGSDC